MTQREVEEIVSALPYARLLYASERGVVVEGRGEDRKTCWYAIRPEDLENATRADLEGVLSGARPLRVMSQTSRVVGYYSQLHNWNRSKIAELKDRHKGNYTLPGSEVRIESHAWPQEVVDEQLSGHAENAVCKIPA